MGIMHFNFARPNSKYFALDDDWYSKELIRQRNAEDRKKMFQEQKEAQSLARKIAPQAQMIKNFAQEKRPLYKTFAREERSINFQQKKLDLDWNNELKKRTTMFRDKNRALDTMFDDGFARKWNEKSITLFERQKKNHLRMYRII